MNNAHKLFDDVTDGQLKTNHDPRAVRNRTFTIKVNAYDLELIEECARDMEESKTTLFRRLLSDYAKMRGIV